MGNVLVGLASRPRMPRGLTEYRRSYLAGGGSVETVAFQVAVQLIWFSSFICMIIVVLV